MNWWTRMLNWLSRATGIGYRDPPALPPLSDTPEFRRADAATRILITRARSDATKLGLATMDQRARLHRELRHLQRELQGR